MAEWFRRTSKNIKTFYKRDTQEGSWLKCPSCGEMSYRKVLEKKFYVCGNCEYHFRITSDLYIKLLIDNNKFQEFGANITSKDPLNFKMPDKSYTEQIEIYKNRTKKNSAVTILKGKINNSEVILGVMDFNFIGGSMGAVVGHKLGMAIDLADKEKLPLLIITASGGARMQEGSYSLMQLAKTSSKLAKFSQNGGLYVVLLTDPTTGGISASIAMLGDVIISEPNALIGFAGPRVIKQTIGQDLPEGFQKAEFLLEKGFIDYIVNRNDLKDNISRIINILKPHE
jgi:acetyl-CoA carboxylase carboxyl transferase subunit beta